MKFKFLILFLYLSTIAAVSSSSIYVDNSAGSNGDGTSSLPYNTLTAALTNAATNTNVDTIFLIAGQSLSDLDRTFTISQNLNITAIGAVYAYVNIDNNAQIIANGYLLSFNSIQLQFGSTLQASSLIATNSGRISFSWCSLTVLDSLQIDFPVIEAQSGSTISLLNNSVVANLTTSSIPWIVNASSSSTVIIKDTVIKNITLVNGGLFLNDNTSSIQLQNVTLNLLNISMPVIQSNGGAITIQNSSMNNISLIDQPLVFINASLTEGNLTVASTSFSDILTINTDDPIALINCIGSILEVSDSRVSGTANGKLISVNQSTLANITNTTFELNSSSFIIEASTSVLVLENVYQFIFQNSIIDGFYSTLRAPGIVFSSNATELTNLQVKHSLSHSSSLSISNSTFHNLNGSFSTSQKSGGAIFLDTSSPVMISDSLFQNNTVIFNAQADQNGIGGPCLRTGSLTTQLTVLRSNFSANKAQYLSNCLEIIASSVTITNCSFDNNAELALGNSFVTSYASGNGRGGAIYAQITQSLVIEGSSFSSNSASNGGDILLNPSSLADTNQIATYLIHNSTLLSGSAKFGGSIYLGSLTNSTLNISQTRVLGTVADQGGIIYSQLAKGSQLIITDCEMGETYGATGALLQHLSSSEGIVFNISNSYFHDTIEQFKGGGGLFFASNSSVYLFNNSWYQVNSQFRGAPIYASQSNIIDMSSYYSNSDCKDGNIHIYGASSYKAIDCVFENMTASTEGAFLTVMGASTAYLENITMNNMSTSVGAAIAKLAEGSVAIFNNSKANNIHGVLGAAFYLRESSSLTLVNTEISNVQATVSVVHATSSNVFLQNVSFTQASTTILDLVSSSTIQAHNLTIDSILCGSQVGVCVMSLWGDSRAIIDQLTLFNITTDSDSDVMLVENSLLTLANSTINGTNTSSSGSYVAIVNANVSISNTIFENPVGECVLIQHSGQLRIENSVFYQTFSSYYESGTFENQPFISGSGSINIVLTNCSFSNASYSGEGGAISLYKSKETNSLSINITSDCTFERNAALNGGAIGLLNVVGTISNSSFKENLATGYGGAIFIDNPAHLNMSISDSTFLNNKAEVGGGVIAFNDSILFIEEMNNILSNNTVAGYGPVQATKPAKAKLIISNTVTNEIIYDSSNPQYEAPPTLSGLESARQIPLKLTFEIVDQFEQITSSLLGSPTVALKLSRKSASRLLQTNSSNQSSNIIQPSFISSTQLSIVKGTFSFESFQVFSLVPDGLLLTVSIPAIKIPTSYTYSSHESTLNGAYEYTIELTIRDCFAGEIKQTYADKQLCKTCPPGTYSFDPQASTCAACPEEAICYGGTNMSIKPGYWRKSNTSTAIYPCNYEKACPGGTGYDCAAGYTGALCSSCIQYDDPYYSFGGSECMRCPQSVSSLLLGIGVVVAYIIYAGYNIWTNLKDSSENTRERKVYLKVLNNYLQLYSISLGGQCRLPSQVMQVLKWMTLGNISKGADFLQCISIRLGYFTLPQAYLTVIYYALQPYLVVAILAIFWLLLAACFPRKRKNLLKEFIVSVVTWLYLILPGTSAKLLGGLSCTYIDSERKFLPAPIYECNDSSFRGIKFGFILPTYILWIVLVPVGLMIYLRKLLKKKNEQLLMFDFIYQGYQRRYYYWDAVIFLRLALVSIVNIVIDADSYSTSLLLICFLALSLYATDVWYPYKARCHNILEVAGLLVIMLTIFIALYNSTIIDSNQKLSYGLLGTSIILQLGFLSLFAFYFFRHMRQKRAAKQYQVNIELRHVEKETERETPSKVMLKSRSKVLFSPKSDIFNNNL